MRKLSAVEVVWEDSQSSDAGWLMKGEEFNAWAKSGPLVIRTVGLLFRKTRRTLVVIQCDGECDAPESSIWQPSPHVSTRPEHRLNQNRPAFHA
jgi:hypothetical protein